MLGICVDGRDVRSETRYGAFGAHVLLISTAIGDIGVQLHAGYVGGASADTQVAELFVAPAGDVRSSARAAPATELPVVYARSLCLYDHLLSLQLHLVEHGYESVAIEIDDAALAILER